MKIEDILTSPTTDRNEVQLENGEPEETNAYSPLDLSGKIRKIFITVFDT